MNSWIVVITVDCSVCGAPVECKKRIASEDRQVRQRKITAWVETLGDKKCAACQAKDK
jgi:hypothetical protein